MQNWNDEVQRQLNNLPGFPAIPNTATPTGDRWILGDWIGECRVRPRVASAALLPLTENAVGDVRVAVAEQSWYIWDGATWQSMGGGGGGGSPTVVDVPATAQESLQAGDLVCLVNNGGSANARKADATGSDDRLNPVGFAVVGASAGEPLAIRVAGTASVPVTNFDVAPISENIGKRVFVSTTQGRVTLAAPTTLGGVVQRVGVLTEAGESPKMLVQIGDPVFL